MNSCVVGLQWGDEGKGKVVDILCSQSEIAVRYSGGANAGHTVVVGDERFALHLLPSAAVREDTTCVISNGVVVDPACLIEEIEALSKRGISFEGRLRISENAHMVMDYHKSEDKLREASLGKKKIGTTARGIGPCYADKVGRSYAVRFGDMADFDAFAEKLRSIVEYKNKVFAAVYGAEPADGEKLIEKCRGYADKLLGYSCDTTEYLHEQLENGKSILFEGAQGALLDLDHGTFPYVTSSNASALGMPPGSGVPAKYVDKFLGVVKAYTTRVGAGPFPSEQDNEIGDYIRDKGNEYGTTTGRPRRCGWFDAVAVRYTARIGSIDEIGLMHLDTMAGLEEISLCRSYNIDGKETRFFPANTSKLDKVECIYEKFPGWNDDLSEVRKWEDLPASARNYVKAIEELVECPIKVIGVGPKRTQTIFR